MLTKLMKNIDKSAQSNSIIHNHAAWSRSKFNW